MSTTTTCWRALVWTTLVLSAAGPVSPVSAAESLEDVARYVAYVEQAKGHLLASREVFRRGQAVRARVHAGHPMQEIGYRLWRPVGRVDAELGRRVQAAVKAPGEALAPDVDGQRYEATIQRALEALDRAVAAVVPARFADDPRLHARVMRDLLLAIEEEYGEAIAQGRVVLEIEYQDAWGFFQRLHALWSRVRPALVRAAPVVDEQMAVLASALSRIDTPSAPVDVERVNAALARARQALGDLTNGPGSADAPRARR
ncbi:MAG TPA: hypothetical protein VNN07_17680 [Candidatus Tectomicrobia bacterium]|nr:hypothetical protein [Candidatus Tectomicrobia bacterium]